MATQVALAHGPLTAANGSLWSRHWPQKGLPLSLTLGPLIEDLEEGVEPVESEEELDDEATYLNSDRFSHFLPYKSQASPGAFKAAAETSSVPTRCAPTMPMPLGRAESLSPRGDLALALQEDGVGRSATCESMFADDPRCDTLARFAKSGNNTVKAEDSRAERYDVFLSHLQRNAQDTITSLQMFLKEVRPGLRFFIDVDVDMTDGLHETLRRGVMNCKAFLFFITDGVLGSIWCAQELRWAVEYGKNIVLVRETDERHGGIEMKDFFEQVPEDFLPVFKNNIAIPWYREKGFRGVSVHAILKRAALEDEHANELQKLQATKRQLTAVVRQTTSSTTAFHIIQQRSLMLKIVIFTGGFGTFEGKRAQQLYDIVFNLSFWTCGTLCLLNLIYRKTPYHNFPTDALTAYVHFPAWQSWIVWRRFVKSSACAELLSNAQAKQDRQSKFNAILRYGGWVVLAVQCAMVVDVLLGFSLPRTLDIARDGDGHDYSSFADVHALMMWVVIPPVIAAMFASYVMFGFIALLHLLDILATNDLLSKCIEPLAGYYDDPEKIAVAPAPDPALRRASRQSVFQTPRASDRAVCTGAESSSVEGSSEFGGSVIGDVVDNLQEFQRRAALEDSLFRTVAELLVFLIDGVQTRIDHTSNAVGGLWVHLVFFSVAQVLAISSSLEAFGTTHTDPSYRWWWCLQDFFHLGGGIVLLMVAMGVFCIVTAFFNRVPLNVFKLLAGAGVPVSRQASVVSLLGTRPLGMRVGYGLILVDMTKACGFFFVLLLLMLDKIMFVLSIVTQFAPDS